MNEYWIKTDLSTDILDWILETRGYAAWKGSGMVKLLME